MAPSTSKIRTGSFAPTRWTLVLRARGDSPEAHAALSTLCEAYWQPVYQFLRREGRDDDSARELTQEFFARLLARGRIDSVEPGRGRFRSFLLGAVKHFLADLRDRERAAKRGGGKDLRPLDCGADTKSELPLPDPTGLVPDMFFDREWALALVGRAVAALEAKFAEDNRSHHFQTLKPWLLGDVESFSQSEAARVLGLSESAVKVAIHRLRKRFREMVKQEIAQTVADPAAAREELLYLLEVLSRQI